MMGHDLTGTRVQAAENQVLPPLVPAWTFDANRATHDTGNEVTGYPVVSDGCLFVGTSTGNEPDGSHRNGWVVGLNADNGDLVWRTQVGGGVYSTLAVDNGVVYAFVSRVGSPFVTALRATDGEELWSTTVDLQPGSDAVSSPVVYDGMVWVGVSGTAAEGDSADRTAFQGSSVLLAADTGAVIKKIWTIDPSRWADGFAGGSQWGTISIDPETGYGYEGTGNPFNYDAEDPHTNAVLKIDLDRDRPATFGTIVASYKGDVEQYFPAANDQAACNETSEVSGAFALGLDCAHLDLDFGAQPNIFKDGTGRTVIVAGQKSGVLHFVDASDMSSIAKVLVGVPSAVGGIVGSAAFDGAHVYGPHTIGGYLWSVDATTHQPSWISPTGDGVHWGPPVTYANKVLYTVDLKGFLDLYDAATGAPLEHIPMAVGSDTGRNPPFSWGGVTVARHMAYASVGVGVTSAGLPSMPNGFVIAYRGVGPIA